MAPQSSRLLSRSAHLIDIPAGSRQTSHIRWDNLAIANHINGIGQPNTASIRGFV